MALMNGHRFCLGDGESDELVSSAMSEEDFKKIWDEFNSLRLDGRKSPRF